MSKTYNKNCIAKPSYEKHSIPNNNKKVVKKINNAEIINTMSEDEVSEITKVIFFNFLGVLSISFSICAMIIDPKCIPYLVISIVLGILSNYYCSAFGYVTGRRRKK